MSYYKKNKHIQNIFLNKSNILFQNKNNIVIKYLNSELGIWIERKYLYPSKFANQICIGIDLNNNHQIINNTGNVIKQISGEQLITELNNHKTMIKEQWISEINENKLKPKKEPLWNNKKATEEVNSLENFENPKDFERMI